MSSGAKRRRTAFIQIAYDTGHIQNIDTPAGIGISGYHRNRDRTALIKVTYQIGGIQDVDLTGLIGIPAGIFKRNRPIQK